MVFMFLQWLCVHNRQSDISDILSCHISQTYVHV